MVATMEATLWAFYRSNSFREGALMAVNLGEDADTTGAVYGEQSSILKAEVKHSRALTAGQRSWESRDPARSCFGGQGSRFVSTSLSARG